MIVGVATQRPSPRPFRARKPNDVALRLTGRDYVSFSAISTYQRCPLRYFFGYIAGLPPDFKSSSLIFGGAIHRALEHHCCRAFEGAAPPSVDELVAVYERAWRDEAAVPVRFGKSESAESLRDLAQRILAAFQASKVSKLDTQLLAIEEEFRAPVIPGCPDLLGRVDLVVLEHDALRITDFKTSRSKWNEAKVQESAPQMLLYSELLWPLATALGVRELRLEWIVITKTKRPDVEVHSLTPDPRQVARTKAGAAAPRSSARRSPRRSRWLCRRWRGAPGG